MLEIRLRFLLTFIYLFYLIIYLVTFNTNNKLHFLIYILTRMSNSTSLSFNLCMFTEEDGATINNKGKKNLCKKKC